SYSAHFAHPHLRSFPTRRSSDLDRERDILTFTALAGLGSTAVSATIGVTSLSLGGAASWERFGAIWLTWWLGDAAGALVVAPVLDRKSTRLNSSHVSISYAVFCL